MESEVYISLGCRQTLRAITMASAEGLVSWAVKRLSLQRQFLGARLHVQLRVDFLAESMWKGCLWPHLACPVLIHIYIHKITVCWRKKAQASLLPIGWCTCDTVPDSTTEPAVITLPWTACTFFILQVRLLRRRVFRCLDCSHWFSHVKYHFFQHLLHSFPSIHHILLNSAWHPSSSRGLTEILLR